MHFLRIPALLAVTVLALSACNRAEEAAKAAAANPLLAYVPADTPYLYANIEATPPEVIDAFILRAGPALAAVRELFDDLDIKISTSDTEEHHEARLVAALLTEFDGKLNREGLESLGLSLESHVAIYGMGVFPVIRVSLHDADALRGAIARVETASGMDFERHNLGEYEYWKITDGEQQAGVYIAILNDHFAISMFPSSAESEWLPAFLGQTLPADSTVAAKQLAQLNRDKGYSNYGSGYIDLQRLAGEFLDGDSKTAALLKSLGHHDPASLDEQCVAEIRGLISHAPRLVGGTTELSADTVGISYQVELEKSLAARLVELVADVPVAGRGPDKVLTASLGLNIGRVRNFLIEQATAIGDSPFQCEQLQAINRQAAALLAQLQQPMPPFLGNLKGFRLSLDELDYENFSPENISGMFALEVEKPQMLVGTAQMFVPGLEGFELERGADPVELPQELMSFASADLRVYAAMGDDSIGFAVGASGQAELAAFMDAKSGNDETFFSLEYDMAAQLEIQNSIAQRLSGLDTTPDSDAEKFRNLSKNIQDSYKDWLGRTRLEISFTEDGLQMENTITFK